ncbi:hypothetical protein T01_15947 [Trichinella spiralis]|uniref:Uncharacterized protein n=1 Tax=Trichinella spiralis TaxID=6334 RepID=A0A0V0YQ26_TRISP|nr:hypothetical protein T01_15947 [Trichinella spiralis]
MRCPLQSEFEAALTAFLHGANVSQQLLSLVI